jgi:hypothetical protein
VTIEFCTSAGSREIGMREDGREKGVRGKTEDGMLAECLVQYRSSMRLIGWDQDFRWILIQGRMIKCISIWNIIREHIA